MLIPDTFFYYILHNKRISIFPTISNQANATRAFYANMAPEERAMFHKKRGEAIRKALRKKTIEELRQRTAPATKKILDSLKNPITGKKEREKIVKNMLYCVSCRLKSHNESKVEVEDKRINDYAGNITYSEYESLNGD